MKNNNKYLIIVLLMICSFLAYGQIIGNGFINLDDPGYVTKNDHIRSGINAANIRWAFTAVVVSNWHPLTLISHILDWSFFGTNASGHHLVSLIYHVGAAIFLFLFLNKTTNNIWPSAFVSAFFALHPLRVESVAWVAERKDVLSMFFGMGCLYAYAFYAEDRKMSKYLLCLALFTLSLMSKPMLVTLPFVMILLDYWPLNRWQKTSIPVITPVAVSKKQEKKIDKPNKKKLTKEVKTDNNVKDRSYPISGLLWEKVPFILLAAASGIITLWAQSRAGSIASGDKLTFFMKISNALVSYPSYLKKIFYPLNLSVFYPYDYFLPAWKVIVSIIILIWITAIVLFYIKRVPFLFTGWLWYLITLVPVIGLIQTGSQAIADRYTYLPSIGIAILLTWGILFFLPDNGTVRKKIVPAAGIAILAVLMVLTWRQSGYWKNDFTLFNHAIAVTKNNYLAYTNRGTAYAEINQNQLALRDFNEAINIKKDDHLALFNRGGIYLKLGQIEPAIGDYNEAIRFNPGYADAYSNRGLANAKLARYQNAIDDFSNAIRLRPDYSEDYRNRAVAYFIIKDNQSGCADVRKACELGNCSLLNSLSSNGFCR